MKKCLLKQMALVAVMALTAVGCGPKKTNENVEPHKVTPKMLVIYYSQTTNTKIVAEEIAKRLNAETEEIIAVQPYDGDFKATIERCLQEQEEGILPEVQPLRANLANYDVVFIGYPIWFGTYAPPVTAWLKTVDLSGKKVVPFCTFGSGGLESSAKDLAESQPKADIIEGYGVRAARLDAVPIEVDYYLKAKGFIEGEFVKLEDFSEQHPVSEEETAIFNAAVDGYPMLHAQAKSVAQRSIPNGTEYMYIAVDLPREENADMPQAGEITVYVNVTEGEAPVFTRVVR